MRARSAFGIAAVLLCAACAASRSATPRPALPDLRFERADPFGDEIERLSERAAHVEAPTPAPTEEWSFALRSQSDAPEPDPEKPQEKSASAPAAEASEDDLAKKIQNPVADLMSFPLQFNVNFDTGKKSHRNQLLVNFQPVIPFRIDEEWNLITRTIVPFTYFPSVAPGTERVIGLGDTNLSFLFSPAKAEGFIWGAGPAFLLPTATQSELGTEQWSLGPTAVALVQSGDWTVGAIGQNVWSLFGNENRKGVNQGFVQPFVAYQLGHGWFLNSSPLITFDWKANGGDVWTVPLGAGAGLVTRIGGLPFQISLQFYGNVVRPDLGPDWQARFQIALLLPK